MWFTSINGLSNARAIDFAKDVPTTKEPKSPGPFVKAIPSTSFNVTFALFKAASTTGTMFC